MSEMNLITDGWENCQAETRPICRRCARGNIACGYGIRLVWHEESLAKGLCHGRAGVWSKGSRQNGRNRDGVNSQRRVRPRSPRSPFLCPDGSSVKMQSGQRTGGSRAMFLNTTMRDLELYFQYESVCGDYTEKTQHDVDIFVPSIGDTQNDGCDDNNESVAFMPFPRQVLRSQPAVFQTLDYDPTLLSYYEAVICSSSTLLDDAQNNPYRHLILPMAMRSEGLYHATLAVSAQTLRLVEPKYRVAALKHGQKAMRSLIRILQHGIWTDIEIDEILGLALMLCWFEITDGCRPSWVTHLKGIRALSSRCKELSTSLPSHSASLYRFFNRYFAFHLVLARTAFRVDDDVQFSHTLLSSSVDTSSSHHPLCETQISLEGLEQLESQPRSPGLDELRRSAPFSPSTNLLSLNMSLDELDQIDPYMGFSNSLLLLINEVANLAWQDLSSQSESSWTLLQTKVDRLKGTLEDLHQTPPMLRRGSTLFNSEKEDPNSLYSCTISEFIAIAEANRLGALLFLHEICSNISKPASVASGSTSSVILGAEDAGRHELLAHLTADDRPRYVSGILNLIIQNLNRIMRTAALPLWPLFLAGCCSTSEEDRITVMRIFEESEGRRRFGNIKPAREVVEMVWRQRDLGVQDDRKRRKSAAARLSCAFGKDKDTELDGSGLVDGDALNSAAPSLLACGDQARISPSRQVERFEWERAMSMLGGWKLSLT